jgi:predicted AlkP superfamily pyrophosphatase or phosphodiesterase
MKLYGLLCFFLLSSGLFSQDSLQHIVEGRRNTAEQMKKPYVILISADGFRYDYAEKYNATNLLQLRKGGVQAKSMTPSFPSVTYPNHYSVATGMYPSHHGIVYNEFYDRNRKEGYAIPNRKTVEDGTWYGGIPLWVLAEQQGMMTASYHYVATEAAILNTFPSYWYRYKSGRNANRFIQTVMNWLMLPEEVRPHLITLYLEDVDYAGHVFGTNTIQTKEATLYVDSVVGVLTEKVKALNLPVNFIFLSDHGMADVDTVKRINPRLMVDTSRFIIRGGNTSLHLYAKNKEDIQGTYDLLKKKEDGFIVYLKENIPAKWHFNKKEDRFDRIGDIFIVPVYPKVLSNGSGRISPGAHGFDPGMKEMHAVFYAWGPQFKKSITIPSFENVNIYPMVCELLGLNYSHKIDGKKKVLKKILKRD